MNIHELKLFRHLSDSLHFGKTSRACNITPSALTRMVQRIESELGQPLFVRDNRTVKLTPAGEAFKRYAEDVMQRWSQLQNELASERDGNLRGDLSLYGSVTAVYTILPDILKQYRKMYPEVQINLETGDAAKSLTKLQNGEVDVSIAAIPEKQLPGIEIMKIVDTPLVFIAPINYPETVRYFDKEKKYGGTKEADADMDLKDRCLDLNREIYYNREIDWQRTPIIIADHGLSRERFDRWLSNHNVSPNIYAQVAGNEAIIAMVSLGCGVGVIPELVLQKSPLKEDIVVINVSPALTPFSIGVCTMKKNMDNPRIAAFWKIAAK
ncbi:MAG: LysR family transcriptional regulator [Desulfamplus sp.]|nr:LysR family transcriptional regulator [Desulfamplus sp.]MBF0412656.1 LysR family transcriptional regulator [Desulfamplus sp.]